MNYYIHQNDETKGPYTIGQMRSMWCAGLVTGDTLYCEEGYETWIHLRALVNELEKPQSLAPVQKPPVLPLPRKRRSTMKAALALFGLAVLGVGPLLFWMGSFGESNNDSTEASANAQTDPPLPMPIKETMAVSGIESLPPITVRLNNDLLRVLKMTDTLDELYKRGCSSVEFFSAGAPAEAAALALESQLPKNDPRRDLLVNAFEGYQKVALSMRQKERDEARGLGGESLDALIAVAGIRKVLLTKILEGQMSPEEKNLYYVWRKSLTR